MNADFTQKPLSEHPKLTKNKLINKDRTTSSLLVCYNLLHGVMMFNNMINHRVKTDFLNETSPKSHLRQGRCEQRGGITSNFFL